MRHVRQPATEASERRKLLRWPVELEARLSGSRVGRRTKAVLLDINVSGCCVEMMGRFHPGEFVMIRASGIGPLGCVVIWSEEERIGLRFVEPLHPSVLAHVRESRPPPPDDIERRWRGLGEAEH